MKTITYTKDQNLNDILKRPEQEAKNLDAIIQEIFTEVQQNGDRAIQAYNKRFGGFDSHELKVNEEEFVLAESLVSDELKAAIKQAYENIYTFHKNQVQDVKKGETMPGVICWQKAVPMERVGLYAPGGSAPLFSTILMLAIPAQIAGCSEVVLCTPANKQGEINPVMLYTAKLCGITQVFKVGGVQAIAAMTFGTETIPSVYKLFGPGNQYVTAAKLYAQKFKVSIDMPAGPSEVLVAVDESSNPIFAAADLLAQAEHGEDSQVVLVTNCERKAEEIIQEVYRQLEALPRKDFAEIAISNSVCVISNKEDFAEIINTYAPEHLIVNTKFNDELLEKVCNAGSIFIGQYAAESIGDYASGTNHTLPTNGYAKQYSGVSLDSFIKKITYQEISAEGLQNIGQTVELMAEAEGLFAHKNAVTLRLNDLKIKS